MLWPEILSCCISSLPTLLLLRKRQRNKTKVLLFFCAPKLTQKCRIKNTYHFLVLNFREKKISNSGRVLERFKNSYLIGIAKIDDNSLQFCSCRFFQHFTFLRVLQQGLIGLMYLSHLLFQSSNPINFLGIITQLAA